MFDGNFCPDKNTVGQRLHLHVTTVMPHYSNVPTSLFKGKLKLFTLPSCQYQPKRKFIADDNKANFE